MPRASSSQRADIADGHPRLRRLEHHKTVRKEAAGGIRAERLVAVDPILVALHLVGIPHGHSPALAIAAQDHVFELLVRPRHLLAQLVRPRATSCKGQRSQPA
jgi:hypothetical protein